MVEAGKKLEYTYEIYEVIIARWIRREPEVYTKGNLLEISRMMAKWMLDHTTTHIPAAVVEAMAAQKEINLLPIVAQSRSLLNRNSNGEYKFAHRSFLEYFLAEYVIDTGLLPENEMYLHKMSSFRRFFIERYESILSARVFCHKYEITCHDNHGEIWTTEFFKLKSDHNVDIQYDSETEYWTKNKKVFADAKRIYSSRPVRHVGENSYWEITTRIIWWERNDMLKPERALLHSEDEYCADFIETFDFHGNKMNIEVVTRTCLTSEIDVFAGLMSDMGQFEYMDWNQMNRLVV